MNTPTEYVRVETPLGMYYMLMVSLMPVDLARNISATSYTPVLPASESIFKLTHTLFAASKIKGALTTYETDLVNTNIVENYLESNLH